MSAVVADATILIALHDAGCIEILNRTFTEVFIPEMVYHEVYRQRTPRAKPSFIKVERIEDIQMIKFVSRLRKRLDPGESEAIALASYKKLTLIVDDATARETCARYSMPLLSTEEVVDQMQPPLAPALRQLIRLRGF